MQSFWWLILARPILQKFQTDYSFGLIQWENMHWWFRFNVSTFWTQLVTTAQPNKSSNKLVWDGSSWFQAKSSRLTSLSSIVGDSPPPVDRVRLKLHLLAARLQREHSPPPQGNHLHGLPVRVMDPLLKSPRSLRSTAIVTIGVSYESSLDDGSRWVTRK